MRGLKSLVWLSLVFFGSVAVILPAAWFYTVSKLPNAVESEADIELALRQSIESERQATQSPLHVSVRKQIKWERPELSQYPEKVVNAFIGATGCPTYFKTPKQIGTPYFKRELDKMISGRDSMGDGACELILSRMLARKLGAGTSLQVAVAADRIHEFLNKEQLVTFNLATIRFDDGVIGVAEGSRVLMQRELNELSFAEAAELQLAIPPLDYWDELWECKNAGVVREARDTFIARLVQQNLIGESDARTATAQQVRCMTVKR